ncbi:hypothetical protein IQ07DRAFT_584278 [Pyrenochaeta sp. DS3sAY3a]|nr:hypothetical protein IQ07DRAFT_584278 [Pyrenochaeta sp. DS3sAY3a]
MAKRKRASAGRGFSSLTIANLERLQAELSPAVARPTRSRVPSGTSGESGTTILDQREKLFDYGIHVDEDSELPETLEDHVNALKQPRNVAASPNAKNISQNRALAALENKATGTAHILPYMLFSGEANQDNRVETVPLVTSKANLPFNRHFLPPPPSDKVAKRWNHLYQPNPDTCIGYVKRFSAALHHCDAPFTADEEAILDDYVLTPALYMPFITAQWRTPSHGTLYEAVNKAALDGAAVVNHLYDFYSAARNTPPSIVETCHFSFVSNLEHGQIWIHWREDSKHHMELIHDFSLRSEDKIQEARAILHNIKDYAVTERLASIRQALPAFHKADKKPVRFDSGPAHKDNASAASVEEFFVDPPPTWYVEWSVSALRTARTRIELWKFDLVISAGVRRVSCVGRLTICGPGLRDGSDNEVLRFAGGDILGAWRLMRGVCLMWCCLLMECVYRRYMVMCRAWR